MATQDSSDATDNPIHGTASVVSNLRNWAAEPFNTQMSLTGWALFTGLIIVISILWMMILHDLKGELVS